MSHEHDSLKKLQVATHASLPMLLMLFLQMVLNHYFAPAQSIFVSPYLLAFFVLGLVSFVVFLKGDICPGQKGRLTFVLGFLLIFALGNLLYSTLGTPKHIPLVVSAIASLFFPIIFLRLPQDETIYRTLIYCGLAIVVVGMLQYLLVYWVEIPSIFNWLRANNFAQILLGLLLSGWYLMLAKSRLEALLKLLVKLAIIALILNYAWSVFAFYAYLQVADQVNFLGFILYGLSQFAILGLLGWLLLGKNIKNPTAWTAATGLSMLYPLVNMI
ncbi:hypothetical protein A4G20_04355 [Pasteurellaceae bacterium RH1A]|nr:hypothetical protein A4G20_04355 [Pasteurellaceae bacterium RH1A]